MTDAAQRLAVALSDRYVVERELGAGGMATVYLAHDVRHDRQVAVKVLRPELAAVLGVERFLAEIKITARLDHPHILTLIDSGTADNFLYYVLPFVRGESLRARLERDRQLGLDEAVAITRQVASALAYAHEHGVVHRDIKPENILIHEGEAMLADFGIALAVKEAGGNRLTETGLSLGTPQYMSPEQATGDRTLDARSDVYSLAAVLYEMLAGEPPVTGPTAQAMIAKLMTERPTRLRIVRDTVPEGLDAAVARALAKVPADRFDSATAFAAALSATGARGRGGASALWNATGRTQRWLAVLVVLALMAAAGLWLRRHPLAGSATGGRADPRRVAVLYFRPVGAESLRAVAEGLTEDLIRELSRVRSLQVVSANGVLPWRHGGAAPDSIARALRVGSLVEGSVTQARRRLQVAVSLVDGEAGTVVGSAVFEQPAGDILALRDSVTARVALFLRQRLDDLDQVREDRRRASSPEAWRSVQEARLESRHFDSLLLAGDTALARRALARVDTLLAHAVRVDPGWPTPRVERSWLAWRSRALPTPVDAWTTLAIREADAALAIEPGNADALAVRGTARYFRFLFNLGAGSRAVRAVGDSAEADLRAATAADPAQAYAWSVLSHRLLRESKAAEGKLAALRGYEADPYAADAAGLLYRLSSSSLDLEDGVEARRWCAEGRARFPADPYFVDCQLTNEALPGSRPDLPALWSLAEESARGYPPAAREYRRRRAALFVAMALARSGLDDSARAVALRARATATMDPARDLVYVEMLLRNILGDRDEALRLAAEYLAANPQDRASACADRTWWLRGLVEDPRFRALACIRP